MLQKDNYIVDIEKGYLLFYNKSYGDNVVFRYTKPNESIIVDASYNVLRNDVKSDATVCFYFTFTYVTVKKL